MHLVRGDLDDSQGLTIHHDVPTHTIALVQLRDMVFGSINEIRLIRASDGEGRFGSPIRILVSDGNPVRFGINNVQVE